MIEAQHSEPDLWWRSIEDVGAEDVGHVAVRALGGPRPEPTTKRVRGGRRIAIPEQIAPIVAQVIDFSLIITAGVATELLVDAADGVTGGFGFSRIAPAIGCLSLGAAHIIGAYDVDQLYVFKEAWRRVVAAWLSTILFVAAALDSVDLLGPASVRGLSLWFVSGALALVLGRRVFVGGANWLRVAGTFNHVAVIFGCGRHSVALARRLVATEGLALSLIGICDDTDPERGDLPVPYLGGIEELIGLIRADIVDQVIIAMPWSAEDRLRSVVERLAHTPVEVRLAPEPMPLGDTPRQILLMAGMPLVGLLQRPLTDSQRYIKAAEDRLLSLLALIALAPLMAVIAIAVRLDSPGPILFRQPREGFNCRSFSVLKFRTMHAALCATDNIAQTQRIDPRVTRIGAWLRRSSLDELPQLLNVLCGQMSLVGPRPHAPSTRAGGKLFADVATSYARRHNVKPGLTGWAQVNGWRGETDTEEKLVNRLNYDLEYMERWSLFFDLYILIRTIWVVVGAKGAY